MRQRTSSDELVPPPSLDTVKVPGFPDSDANESMARIRTIGRFVVGWAKVLTAKATRKQAAKYVPWSWRRERIILIQLKPFYCVNARLVYDCASTKLVHKMNRKSRRATRGLLRRAWDKFFLDYLPCRIKPHISSAAFRVPSDHYCLKVAFRLSSLEAGGRRTDGGKRSVPD